MIRVAMLSFWHVHAKDYARLAAEHPDTEIVAVWDEDQSEDLKRLRNSALSFMRICMSF